MYRHDACLLKLNRECQTLAHLQLRALIKRHFKHSKMPHSYTQAWKMQRHALTNKVYCFGSFSRLCYCRWRAPLRKQGCHSSVALEVSGQHYLHMNIMSELASAHAYLKPVKLGFQDLSLKSQSLSTPSSHLKVDICDSITTQDNNAVCCC